MKHFPWVKGNTFEHTAAKSAGRSQHTDLNVGVGPPSRQASPRLELHSNCDVTGGKGIGLLEVFKVADVDQLHRLESADIVLRLYLAPAT